MLRPLGLIIRDRVATLPVLMLTGAFEMNER